MLPQAFRSSRLDFVFFVPGMPFNGDTLKSKSLGGSESAALYLARALSQRGHAVTVFSNGEPGNFADVTYLSAEKFRSYAYSTSHDVCVVQRLPQTFATPMASRLNWLWCHDLALKRNEGVFKNVLWNVDRVLVLSQFMAEQYKRVYGIPDSVLMKTRNGVDLSGTNNPGPINRKRIVYAARPERGLDQMLAMMKGILAREPEAKLALCTYDNVVDEMRPFYEACAALARQLPPGTVEEHGALTKEQLFSLYLSSGVYAYPTPSVAASPRFAEVSCISAMEAMACGLPFVTTRAGALPETLGDAGILTSKLPGQPGFEEEFIDKVCGVLAGNSEGELARVKGLRIASELEWSGVAEQWEQAAHEQMVAKSSNLASTAFHFYRRSDIVALDELLKRNNDQLVSNPALRHLRTVADHHWGFALSNNKDAFRKHYEKIGSGHDYAATYNAAGESRFSVLKGWIQSKPEIKTVLDYGCAHGGYAVNLADQVPSVRVLGVDVDKHSVDMAVRFANEKQVTDRARFRIATHENLPGAEFLDDDETAASEPQRKFDCALVQEVLEHTMKPWEVLYSVEQRVAHGGYVYITVPFGPWEYMSYHTYPHRCHLWEFDIHDLRDLLRDKRGVNIASLPYGPCPETNELLGWWVVSYKVDRETPLVHPINMDRKLAWQAPRGSVSLNVMAGGDSAEETVLWSLKSMKHVFDEAIIVDCGMSSLAVKEIDKLKAEGFNIVMLKHDSPTKVGFETPRNFGLQACSCEWVLWADTDERMLGGENLTKYLRKNVFNGYSVKQHHFAVDTSFNPDLPVRVFRRESGCRWFGMIHEHPEISLNSGPGLTLVIPDVNLAHVGYLAESGRMVRFGRNYPLLLADMEKYPDRILQKLFIMRDNLIRVNYELRQNGSVVTEPMREIAREVIATYRKHFAGKQVITSSDPLEYYSDALRILGEGFEMAFSLGVGVEGVPKETQQARYRFANVAEAIEEVGRRVRNGAQPLLDENY